MRSNRQLPGGEGDLDPTSAQVSRRGGTSAKDCTMTLLNRASSGTSFLVQSSRLYRTLSLSALSGALAILPACIREGDDRLPVSEPFVDPCTSPANDLSGGIQEGDDLLAVFECLNRDGQFDAFAPTVEAMAISSTTDGSTTLLDMWVEILKEEVGNLQDGEFSLEVADLVVILDQAQELLNQPWLDTGIYLVGDVLESGAVEPAIPLLGNIASELVRNRARGDYDDILDQLVTLICPATSGDDQCVGDVVQLYSTLMEISGNYDPTIPDNPAYPLPDGESMANLLSSLLAPAGSDLTTNAYLNAGLGRGVARLGDGDFLLNTLGTYVPALYGDDPLTSELEGYESYNVNRSALYGILNAMTDPEYYAQITGMLNELDPLLNKYYVFSLTSVGSSTSVKQNQCKAATDTEWSNASDFAQDNPANYGFPQILRLLKAANVSYTENSLCQLTVEAAIPILVDVYNLELSGSTNIATLMLEAFSQLPVDDVIAATDASNLPQGLLDAINSTCGLYVLQDDMEALQKSVHMPAVIEPTLKLLKLVNHAAKQGEDESSGAGVGGMETIKDLLVGLYDTQMLCDAQPWLGTVLVPGNPLGEPSDGLTPFLPGGAYHDRLTLPLLRTLARLGGDPAATIVPPLAAGLSISGEPLGGLLTGIGQLGRQATLEANAGQEPALYQLSALMKELAANDPNHQAINGLVAVVDERTLLTGVMETLGNRNVAETLGAQDPDGNAPVAFLSEFVNSGKLSGLLQVARSLLTTLDEAITASSSEPAAKQSK